ncbi:MAG: hypothetical protein H6579_05055 [Chitinophagales bacterium]|nr:hypothetical protein [Chitinophagales bacterium]
MIFFKSKYATYLYVFLGLVLCYFVFGFYFERYEPLAVSLIGGTLTPGMIYDDFFYLAHLFIVKLFAYLFYFFPNLAWLSIFQYTYLLISFVILLNLLKAKVRNKFVYGFLIISLSAFFMEYYVMHVMTRVSFILSFAALLKIISNFHEGKKQLTSNFLFYFLFLLAVFIRPEPPSIILLITSLFYFLVYNQDSFVLRIKRSFTIFIIPALTCGLAIAWVAFSIYSSDEFYKRIEPEVEYELSARNNLVPLDNMHSKMDSLRYEAIYLGIWGDATTNDADFLRSLIGEDEENLSYLIESALSGMFSSAENCINAVLFNFLAFLLLFLFLIFRNPSLAIRVLIFQFAFYFIVFLMGFKVKMVETSLSPMMFTSAFLNFLVFFKQNRREFPLFVLLGMGVLFYLQIAFLNEVSKDKKESYRQGKLLISTFENEFPNKDLYIDEMAFELIFRAFKPFQIIQFKNIEKIIVFDMEHLATVQPYKSYLASQCQCDPNNYLEYFSFIQENHSNSVFLIDKYNAEFFKEYLNGVHGLSTTWHEISLSSSPLENGQIQTDLRFFRIEGPQN